MAVSDIFKADVADLLFRDVRNLSQSSGKTTSDLLKVDVADILFRDVRSLSKPSGRSARAKNAGAWLKGLEDATPEKAVHELTERLADALAREHDANNRLVLLFGCEDASAEFLAILERATETAALPLPAAAQQSALAADSLLKAMGIAYGRLAEGLDAKERSPAIEEAIQQAALRAMRVLGRRQMLAYRACATASAAAWKTMHDLYALARRQGVAATKDDLSSMEQEYVTALLLAVADPGRMPRESVQAVRDFIAALAPLAGLVEAATYKAEAASPAAFLLAPGRGRGGHGMSQVPADEALPPNSLVLDCSALVAEIGRHIEEKSAQPPLPAEVLRLLHDTWAGVTAERRFHRTQFLPRADLVLGFKEILGFFTAAAAGKGRADAGGPEGDNASGGDWSIVNESPDSFGIRHLGPESPPRVEIGDLAVLLPREHSNQVCVCLVRRITPGAEHFELGLQQLCAQASVVTLPSEDITAFGQQLLLLPRLPGFGNATGVIAAAGTLKPDTVIPEKVEGVFKRFKLGSRVAASSAIEFHLLQAA